MCLKYIHPPEECLKKSRTITNKGLEESLKFLKKETKLDKNTKIDVQLLLKKKNSEDIKIAKKCGGGFVDKVRDNEYKIRLLDWEKSINECALLHEILHIKLGHSDKEKRIPYNLPIIHCFVAMVFNIEVNKELIKYKQTLAKRKVKNNRL